MSTKKMKIGMWLIFLVLLCLGIYKAFQPIYLTTQNLKSSSTANKFTDINLDAIPSISRSLEHEAIKAKRPEPLSPENHAKRQRRLADLASRYPTAHEFYTSKCLSCHGPVGEGGKILRRMDSRFSYRAAPYTVPPIYAHVIPSPQGEGSRSEWTTNLENFYNAATKLNRPNLPRTSGITDKFILSDLQKYLAELTR